MDVGAVLTDSSTGAGIASQTLTATETPQGGVTTPIPNMTTDPAGSALETVSVQVPATYAFAVNYAGATVGSTVYSASSGSASLHVGTKTLSGAVSAQAAAGETVTIVVTRPDGTKETLTALTQPDKTFSVEMDDTQLGSYSAVASIAADATYSAATSPVATTTL